MKKSSYKSQDIPRLGIKPGQPKKNGAKKHHTLGYLGDCITSLRDKWEQGTLEDICEQFEINYNTAAAVSKVCRAFEFCRRRQNLSFGHHAEVANRADADELLDWSEETGASS